MKIVLNVEQTKLFLSAFAEEALILANKRIAEAREKAKTEESEEKKSS